MEDNIIKPSEGHWLTQAQVENEGSRFFSDLIILGVTDKAENYVEWTDEEKVAWEEEHKPEEEEPTDESTEEVPAE